MPLDTPDMPSILGISATLCATQFSNRPNPNHGCSACPEQRRRPASLGLDRVVRIEVDHSNIYSRSEFSLVKILEQGTIPFVHAFDGALIPGFNSLRTKSPRDLRSDGAVLANVVSVAGTPHSHQASRSAYFSKSAETTLQPRSFTGIINKRRRCRTTARVRTLS
jgi:hypothetical protein